MDHINLDSPTGIQDLRALIKTWTDDPQVAVPLVVIKISEAFSMYHQVSSADLTIHNQDFNGSHPVLINDLDTNQNVLLTMNQNGVILHFYLIDDQGRLHRHDHLRKVAAKNANQEYLDYFYCLAKNIEDCVPTGHP